MQPQKDPQYQEKSDRSTQSLNFNTKYQVPLVTANDFKIKVQKVSYSYSPIGTVV
jgi:hypothetical protein